MKQKRNWQEEKRKHSAIRSGLSKADLARAKREGLTPAELGRKKFFAAVCGGEDNVPEETYLSSYTP